MTNPDGGRSNLSLRRGAVALAGVGAFGLAALAGCGVSDADGGSAAGGGDVDCAVVEAPLVETVVVGSFADDDGDPTADLTADEMAAAFDELPSEYRAMGDAAVEVIESSDRLGGDLDDGVDVEMAQIEEAQRVYDEFEDEYIDDLESATYWAAERCAGDRVLWACFDGNTKPRFRPVGQAISEDGEPSVDVAGDTPEDVLDVEGWTEVLRTDEEAVFADLDEDGRAVAVRTAERGDATNRQEGWGKVFDISCSDEDLSEIDTGSSGGFEEIGEEILLPPGSSTSIAS